MMDEVEAKGDFIDCAKLSKQLGVMVVPIIARTGKGIKELMAAVTEVVKSHTKPAKLDVFNENIKTASDKLAEILIGANQEERDWKVLKILEGDEIVTNELPTELKESVKTIVNAAESRWRSRSCNCRLTVSIYSKSSERCSKKKTSRTR
jgi:ferrous iron transport protein B